MANSQPLPDATSSKVTLNGTAVALIPQMMPGPNPFEVNQALGREVLIVEDQPGTRLALVELMRRRGYHPVGVESAEEALRRIGSNGCPDVVLADLDLPGMDGFSMVQQILTNNPGTQAVMITAQLPPHREEPPAEASGMAPVTEVAAAGGPAPATRPPEPPAEMPTHDLADTRPMRPLPWLRKPLDIHQLMRVLEQPA